ncbi:MAG: FkbM family methyltransferase, partial [Planctomycetes bacterium]|nr:FkbM family methyltransferase [Planctomycetota bacterium]
MPAHKILNKVIPQSGKEALRGAALQLIPTMRHLDMPTRLRHLTSRGFNPKVIFDIGAARGEWARMAHEIFPQSRIVSFEPNAREKDSLERCKAEIPNFSYKLGFLGPKRDTITYSDENTQTSLLSDAKSSGTAKAEMYVLDELIAAGEIPQPEFMKLDVQGFELEVLRGAEKALKSGPALLLEVSFIDFLPHMPLVEDVMKFMSERDYVWHDVMGLSRRPGDDTLWQMD